MASSDSPHPQQQQLATVVIEYCSRCKWLLRSAYFAQELLTTFDGTVQVLLRPATISGTFRIDILHPSSAPLDADATAATGTDTANVTATVWDRRVDGGFPDVNELKRRVRDVVAPNQSLGHIDKHSRKKEDPQSISGEKGEEATPRSVTVPSTISQDTCTDGCDRPS